MHRAKNKIYTLFAASPSKWQVFKANAPQLNSTNFVRH